MPRPKIRLDHAGIAEVLDSDAVQSRLVAMAHSVEAAALQDPHLQAHGAEVVVDDYRAQGGNLKFPRDAYSVTVKHPGALGIEAKYGSLARAAASAGVTLTRRT